MKSKEVLKRDADAMCAAHSNINLCEVLATALEAGFLNTRSTDSARIQKIAKALRRECQLQLRRYDAASFNIGVLRGQARG